jgi:hypothetical protein
MTEHYVKRTVTIGCYELLRLNVKVVRKCYAFGMHIMETETPRGRDAVKNSLETGNSDEVKN